MKVTATLNETDCFLVIKYEMDVVIRQTYSLWRGQLYEYFIKHFDSMITRIVKHSDHLRL